MAFTFLKTGAASAAAALQNEAMMEKTKEERGKLWRFYMAPGEDAAITFIDGALVEVPGGKGLMPPRFYEHGIRTIGKKGLDTYVCPVLNNPEANDNCPFCEQGERASLIALFTVIDHRSFTTTKGTTHHYTKRLYPAKPTTFEVLNKLAINYGGLENRTFNVSRSTKEMSPAVGDVFMFMKQTDLKELESLFTFTDAKTNAISTIYFPAKYEEELMYRTGSELRAMGHGASVVTGTPQGFGPQAAQQFGQAPSASNFAMPAQKTQMPQAAQTAPFATTPSPFVGVKTDLIKHL